ncbi:hypothetical protein T484DRAFT_1758531, partial [Baffinella frigidus]
MPSKPVATRKCKCLVDGCSKSFNRPDWLQRHVDYIHNKIYHNVCNHINEKGVKCVYKSEHPCHLERHKRDQHSDVAVHKFTCQVDGCNKSHRSPGELKQHVDYEHLKIYHNVCNHINEKGHKCAKKFERPGDLERHTRHNHSDVCGHKCKDCTMAFKTPHDLHIHWVTQHSPPNHPARTKYKCKECNEGFPTSGPLNVHWVTQHSPPGHPARTQHKCKVCNKGFPTIGACTSHYLHNCAAKDDPGRRAFLDRINEYNRAHYASDEMIRIKICLRGSLWRMMNKFGMGKVSLTDKVTGVSCEELIARLNDNDKGLVYGRGVVHIDHIRPMASFKNLKCQVE